MGEAKRRKLKDPSYGKSKDIKISFVEDLEEIRDKDFVSLIKDIENDFDFFWVLKADYQDLIIYGILYNELERLQGDTKSRWHFSKEMNITVKIKRELNRQLSKSIDSFVETNDERMMSQARGYLTPLLSQSGSCPTT